MAMMGAAPSNERMVSFDSGGRGALVVPEADGTFPCVVLIHGLAGNRDEAGGLFVLLARRLAEKGIASLRIDLPGDGDPKPSFSAATMAGYRDAAVAALRYAAGLHAIDRSRLGLLGFSLGALVAARCLPGDVSVRSLVLWAPLLHPRRDLAALLGRDATARLEKDGTVDLEWGGALITIARAFVDSLQSFPILDAIADYSGCVFVLAGSRDRLSAYVEEIAQAASNARVSMPGLIDDADHFFNVLPAPDAVTDVALTVTADVLSMTLTTD